MKTVINPKYTFIEPYIDAIARGEYTPSKVFCRQRNVVELVEIDGHPYVVKRYKKLGPIRGMVYSFFRKSKAERAYSNALRLIGCGFDTPTPVAYILINRMGFLNEAIFISEYSPLPSVHSVFYEGEEDKEKRYQMAHALSKFTVKLHNQGIIPLDFNTSNILFRLDSEGKYHFTLIDINRMYFGKAPGVHKAMRSFFQLGTYPHDYLGLLEPYCWDRHIKFEDALYQVLLYRRHADRLKRLKTALKKLIPG